MHTSLTREKHSLMNIIWRLPDGTVKEQTVADMEQLLFVLRMVGSVSIDESLYTISGSSLVVDYDRLSVAVTLS